MNIQAQFIAMAAPRIDGICRFLDYGSIQFVENRVTGEFLKVHGPDALFGDGPFQMINCEGRPTLVGLDGTDLQRALHVADEHASMRLFDNCGEKPGDDSIVSMDADKGRKRLRLADLKESAEAAAMVIGWQVFSHSSPSGSGMARPFFAGMSQSIYGWTFGG